MFPSRQRARTPFLQYFTLGILLSMMTVYLIHQGIYVVEYLQGRKEAVIAPAALMMGSPVIQSVTPEAEAAGLHPGDKIPTINGEVYRGLAQANRILEHGRPGECFFRRVIEHSSNRFSLPCREERSAGLPRRDSIPGLPLNCLPISRIYFIVSPERFP